MLKNDYFAVAVDTESKSGVTKVKVKVYLQSTVRADKVARARQVKVKVVQDIFRK